MVSLAPGIYSPWSFRPRVISVTCQFGPYLFLSYVISALEHSGTGLIGPKTFWSLVIATQGHFGTESFCSLFISVLCHFVSVSLRPWTFRFWVISMLYHFSSWSSRPRVILLVYLVAKTCFRLCSVQCTRCRCMVWFDLGLRLEFGSVFNLGFYFCIRAVPKT